MTDQQAMTNLKRWCSELNELHSESSAVPAMLVAAVGAALWVGANGWLSAVGAFVGVGGWLYCYFKVQHAAVVYAEWMKALGELRRAGDDV